MSKNENLIYFLEKTCKNHFMTEMLCFGFLGFLFCYDNFFVFAEKYLELFYIGII
jgi:hypothetical protein